MSTLHCLNSFDSSDNFRALPLTSLITTDLSFTDIGATNSVLDEEESHFLTKGPKICMYCSRTCRYCCPSEECSGRTAFEAPACQSASTDTNDLLAVELTELETTLNNLFPPTTVFKSKLDDKKYVCEICKKGFKTRRGLRDHAPVHTGAKDYTCSICNKSYTTKANLIIHKRTHDDVKPFSCTECNKSFRKKDTLNVHLRNHTGEKPFTCAVCSMSFMRKGVLLNHILSHNEKKRFICSLCGKAFSSVTGLKYHENRHEKNPIKIRNRKTPDKTSKDTSILCQFCGKMLSNLSNFRGHELVHSGKKPYRCDICSRVYAKKSSLRTHYRMHNNERLFKCDQCDYAAHRSGTLKTHKLRHSGIRPYACHKCPQKFTQPSSLAYHIKKHNTISHNIDDLLQCDNEKPKSSPVIIHFIPFKQEPTDFPT